MPAGAQIVAFARGWDLSLVVLAAIPALVIIGAVCGIFTARLQASAGRLGRHSRTGCSRDSGGVLPHSSQQMRAQRTRNMLVCAQHLAVLPFRGAQVLQCTAV